MKELPKRAWFNSRAELMIMGATAVIVLGMFTVAIVGTMRSDACAFWGRCPGEHPYNDSGRHGRGLCGIFLASCTLF